jgi:ribosomal protein L31E
MKSVLENKLRLELANSDLLDQLMKKKKNSYYTDVLYEINDGNKINYFHHRGDVYTLKGSNIWFSYAKKYKKFIYAFGVGEVDIAKTNHPVMVIDFPMGGNQDSAGVFGQDSDGHVLLLHKAAFPKSIRIHLLTDDRFEWLTLLDGEEKKGYLLIGILKDKKVIINIINLVNLIHERKEKKSIYDQVDSDIDTSDENPDDIEEMRREEKFTAISSINIIKTHIANRFFTEKIIIEESGNPDFASNLDLLQKLGLLKKTTSGIYFLTSAAETFIKENAEKSDENTNMTCDICGSGLSKTDRMICKDCSRKAYAAKALAEIRKYVEPDVIFKRTDILPLLDNKVQFLDYIWTLDELDLLERLDTDEYILLPEEELNEFLEKYGTVKEEPEKIIKTTELPNHTKTCSICNRELPILEFYKSSIDDKHSEKCKECTRKAHAAKALVELRNYVEPDVEFQKNDLLEHVDNRMQFLDYIWTLQEWDLLEHYEKNDRYRLKPENELNMFQEKYGTKPEKTIKTSKKIVKQCPVCQEVLSVSDFYKSSASDDGYSEDCKECSDKKNAAQILEKIQEYIKMGVSFTKKELSEKLEDVNQVNSYIWTLQEHDLLEHNPKSDTYLIKINSTFQEFVDKYLHKPVAEETKETEAVPAEITTMPEKRDIIYISDNFGDNRINLIMNAIVKNNEILSLVQGLDPFLHSNLNKFLIFKCRDSYSEVMIDLEIDKDAREQALNQLKEEKWINRFDYNNPT